MTVMRRPISCTNSIAMAFHVPAVSVAMGQKMCVLAKLAYFEIFRCAAWSAAAPGVLLLLLLLLLLSLNSNIRWCSVVVMTLGLPLSIVGPIPGHDTAGLFLREVTVFRRKTMSRNNHHQG